MHSCFTQLLIRATAIVCCVLMASSFTGAQKPPEQKKSKNKIRVLRIYDPKKDETATGIMQGLMDMMSAMALVGLSTQTPGRSRLGSQMGALYTFPGKTVSPPEFVRVKFTVFDTERYKTKTDYTVKADGELLLQGKAGYDQRPLPTADKKDQGKDTMYEESLTLVVPTDLFIRLADAKKVQIKIGGTDFDLSATQRESLKALAASIDKCESPDCMWGTLNR